MNLNFSINDMQALRDEAYRSMMKAMDKQDQNMTFFYTGQMQTLDDLLALAQGTRRLYVSDTAAFVIKK